MGGGIVYLALIPRIHRKRYLPRQLQPSSPSMPHFSKPRLRSKTLFSSKILSIVRSPFLVKLASGDNPASLKKASRVSTISMSVIKEWASAVI